jgi:DNA-binding GntR family transcriptional regulator
MGANYAFHDVIYAAAGSPYVERVAKGARRTFIGQIRWVARAEVDDLYERNEREHRAILAAIAAGSGAGAKALARQHVLHSWERLDATWTTSVPAPRRSSARPSGTCPVPGTGHVRFGHCPVRTNAC